jgi:CHASE2 domain-containing sensor protein
MKAIEKVYIYCALLPLIGLLFLMMGLDLHTVGSVFGGRIGGEVFLLFSLLLSFLLGVLGIILIFQARKRKPIIWLLLGASLVATSYGVFIWDRFYYDIF